MRRILLIMIGASLLLQAEFSRDSSGVVADSATGLAWQDDYSDNAGEIKEATWQGALNYCQELSLGGKSDWRLPNKNELFSIVDMSRYNSAISSVFTNVTSNNYWSSTSDASDFSYTFNYAWFVHFHNGKMGRDPKFFGGYSVRCVRGGL